MRTIVSKLIPGPTGGAILIHSNLDSIAGWVKQHLSGWEEYNIKIEITVVNTHEEVEQESIYF